MKGRKEKEGGKDTPPRKSEEKKTQVGAGGGEQRERERETQREKERGSESERRGGGGGVSQVDLNRGSNNGTFKDKAEIGKVEITKTRAQSDLESRPKKTAEG